MTPSETVLREGAEALGLSLTEETVAKLLAYRDLLAKWNRAYNLTAVRDPEQMVSLHLLDSLSIAPFITAERYLDVGTGAGLPGLVLALVCPEKHFDLLDSNGKKTRFLIDAVARLGIDNIAVHHERVERFQPPTRYDGILSRAFSSLAAFVEDCAQLMSDSTKLLAMKGRYPGRELSQLPKPYIVESCHALRVPGVEGERHLVVIGRANE